MAACVFQSVVLWAYMIACYSLALQSCVVVAVRSGPGVWAPRLQIKYEMNMACRCSRSVEARKRTVELEPDDGEAVQQAVGADSGCASCVLQRLGSLHRRDLSQWQRVRVGTRMI